ncbi:MAG: adenylosuccinate synthase [Planctomycetes bacterium]|nr:adenylosuccinate synthase [Planctomycetota bacterium]
MDFHQLGNTSVIGLQWGDEGKGKIVDLLTEHFDVVVRYAGGANAGHTVRIGHEKFALHLIPSGILRRKVRNIIGPGVALDLEIINTEIDGLRNRGIEVGKNLQISNRSHLVMPYHKKQDRLNEARLGADRKIGTTAKGIGPCYADKMLRSTAFRMGDLYRPDDFRRRLAEVVEDRNKVFAALYGDAEPMDARKIADEYLAYAERLRLHVADTTMSIHDALARGDRMLFEGAQGSLLDLNHGTFPYVTSSTCTSGGVAAGAGIHPSAISSYIGVVKAYATRVGSGPFPTEQLNATGDKIRERGHEYGTTTGRPRRCGWFDAFSARYAVEMSGITQLAVMHLDTLGSFPEVQICTGYRHRGAPLRLFSPDIEILAECEPIYETLPGWDGDLGAITDFEQLPAAARHYLDRLEELLGAPITLVSVGADRMATLHRESRLEMAST